MQKSIRTALVISAGVLFAGALAIAIKEVIDERHDREIEEKLDFIESLVGRNSQPDQKTEVKE